MAFVEYEKKGHVVTVTMNRPERLNAVGSEMRSGLNEAWQRFVEDPDARVAILTGAGRIFCAGRDIKEQAERGGRPGGRAGDTESVVGFFGVPETVKPLIAAVNGGAWGAAWYMVCGCDIAIAAETAVFAMTEVPTGTLGPALIPIMNIIPWLPASELMIRGNTITAQRAYELGLVNYVVPPEQLMPKAREIAEEIAGLPPLHVQKTKELLMMARPRANTYVHNVAWPQATRFLNSTEDTKEAANAFAQKRKPVFKGR